MHAYTETDRQAETDRPTKRHNQIEADRQGDRQGYRETGRQTGTQRDRDTERQTDRRADRPYLSMVGAAVLGDGTLAVHEEAVPATLLGQCRLVALGDEGVQLTLLAADGLHELPTQE